jgi:hypothetical protein
VAWLTHALAIAEAIEVCIRGRDQELATKADVALLRSDLGTGVATLEAKMAKGSTGRGATRR